MKTNTGKEKIIILGHADQRTCRIGKTSKVSRSTKKISEICPWYLLLQVALL